MKITLLFVTILILNLPVFSQIEPPTLPVMQETEEWQTFVPAEEFTLEVPGTPALGIINTATAETVQSRSYMVFARGTYYFMFSDDLKTPDQYKMALKFAESNAPGIRQDVIYGFADNFGFYHKILMVKTDKRIYTFQSISPTKESPSTTRFFSGLKINGKVTQAKEVFVQNQSSLLIADKTPTPIVIYGSTDKTAALANTAVTAPAGNGISSSSGSAAVASAAPKTSPATVTSIKILSKPRPSYTDYARFYQIAGVVRARVTFLANGKIGSVTPVTKLPFGLTEQAMNAARAVTFEPATVNSVPMTVTKLIEYSFLIY